MKIQPMSQFRSASWALVLGLLAAAFAAQEPPTKHRGDIAQLSASETALLEYLRLDWAKQYRTTSVGVATKATGAKLSDASRLRLARVLDASRSGNTAPARHGVATVVLTPEEKLIARAILLEEIHSGRAATAKVIGQRLNVSPRSLMPALRFLRDFEAIAAEDHGDASAYRVASRYPRRPSYRIDFFSHQVEVNGRDKFEVA